MNCICPMRGGRPCPDNCLIAAWHSLPDNQKTKERRLPIVEMLCKQSQTQQAIAIQLGVSQDTVSRDLLTLTTVVNVKGQGKDTLGRKRSTGRPKGSKNSGKKKTHSPPKPNLKADEIITLADTGKTDAEIAATTGVTKRTVRRELEHEAIRREAEPAIDPATLSLTAQKKFDLALKQATLRLETEIKQRLRTENTKWMEDVLAMHRKKEAHYNLIISRHKGILTSTEYNLLWSCLHPDSRNSTSDEKLAKAFQLFTKLENLIIETKDPVAKYGSLPKTTEELLKHRAEFEAKRAAERAAKRAAKNSLSQVSPR